MSLLSLLIAPFLFMKTAYCFLKKFNNYFNRKIKKFSDLADYISEAEDYFIPVDSLGNYLPFDFNPNDEVTTDVIVNGLEFHPDYFLELDENGDIVSRWFVLEQKRNRKGQWIYYLRRDVIADNLESLLDSPFFVQKGMLKETDKFILNDEGMSFNQIKQQENFILDKSETAWLVGYLAKNTDGTDIDISIPADNLSSEAISLSDLASTLGTTEGILVSLLNFNEEINNYICFTKNIDINFVIRYRGQFVGDTYYYRYNFSDTLDYELTDYRDYGYIPNNILFNSIVDAYTLTNNLNTAFSNAVETYKSSLLSQIPSIVGLSYYFNQNQLNILKQYEGKIIFYNSKYYELNLKDFGNITYNKGTPFAASLYSSLSNIATKTATDLNEISLYDTPEYIDFVIRGNKIALSLNERKDFAIGYNATISSSRISLADQEYDMFIIPFEDGVKIRDDDESINFGNIKDVALKAAGNIAHELGKELYDLQLLPYCPIPEIAINYRSLTPPYNLVKYIDLTKNAKISGEVAYSIIGAAQSSTATNNYTFSALSDGSYRTYRIGGHIAYDYDKWQLIIYPSTIGLPSGTELTINSVSFTAGEGIASYDDHSESKIVFTLTTSHTPPTADCIITVNITYTTSIGTPASVIIYCRKSSFQVYTETGIPTEINNADISLKVLSNAYYMRLCSPNYQGSFDVNIGKNNGKIKGFWIYGTYKPYTPYIKVAPLFESLYGSNFGDQRGLICSGDFSLSRIIDEWQNYELNNKNYQNIFNREIQNLEFMQYYERRNQLVSGAVGIVGDTVKGAAAGTYLGGGYGAIAGAVAGGTTSAIGYGIDVDTLAKTQREQKQLAIDKFNYQLGNIKALPYTLTNIGAFNINSKIYPFLEIYTPTEEELRAFDQKIKYESMTVMRIDTMRNYWRAFDDLCYFKAELIRCDDIAENNHILNAIYEEILKGVYI